MPVHLAQATQSAFKRATAAGMLLAGGGDAFGQNDRSGDAPLIATLERFSAAMEAQLAWSQALAVVGLAGLVALLAALGVLFSIVLRSPAARSGDTAAPAVPALLPAPAPAPPATLEAVADRWESVLEGTGHGVWDLNPATGEVVFSPAWHHMLGYLPKDVPNTLAAWRGLIHPADQPQVRQAFESLLAGASSTRQVVYRMRTRLGDYRWVETSAHLMRDAAGRPRRMIGTNTDISERVAAERDLREAATVFEATSEAIMITDSNGTIRRVNQAFIQATGYAADEAIGRTPRLLKSGRHDATFYQSLWERLLTQGRWEGELWNKRKDGEIFPVWQTISAVRDELGKATGFVSLFIDITQKKRDEDEIAYRANYDTLTGLPNRNLLAERLGQALKKARREGSRVAVMFIDLDFFKQVNDSLGHAVGDRLLQLVAERMSLCVRETDTISRLGGDEFVILLMDIDEVTPAGAVAEKLIGQVAEPFVIDGNEIHIGASIGITLFPDDGSDIDTLFRNADMAMYRAKTMGRNNAQFFEPALTTAALDRRALENDLRGALSRQEFRLCFLPLVDLASGRIVGVEALLRWQHPQRGLLEPGSFVPLAEDTGLIREIGSWALDAACQQLAAWETAGHRLTLAINVSIRQLPEALAVKNILAVLHKHGLAPQQLVLEITESVLLAESPAIQQWFVAAGAAGLQLSIDDFGTGYSSLAYLKRFPVRHVKIDRTFIKNMTGDAGDRSLVEAILAMAHGLGLSVVAEGVEEAGQAKLLQARACELAQGYLYSQPLPAAELAELLKKPVG